MFCRLIEIVASNERSVTFKVRLLAINNKMDAKFALAYISWRK